MYRRIFSLLMLTALFAGIPHVSTAGRKADIEIANRVAQWQIDNFGKYISSKSGTRRDQNWVNGTLYRGMVVWGETSGYKPCEDFVMEIGRRTGWSMDTRPYHADDICVGQAYLLLYEKYRDPAMLAPVKERADLVVDHPAKTQLHIKAKDGQKRWSWCDALFMAPPVYAQLTRITGDPKYLKFMNAEFYATTSKLYDTEERLFYRDASFMDMREPNGRKVFWSRGNGWVYAGLAILLETVPESDPSYDFYRRLFLEMTDALLACQDENGSWRPSLLDPEVYPTPENSGSAFFTYGLAWGVNHGILKGKVYRKAAQRSWKTLCSYVREDGRMEYVQPVGARPRITKPDQTEGYGVGAFLLAASEIVKM